MSSNSSDDRQISFLYEGDAPARADRIIGDFLKDRGISRSEVQRWIESGGVAINGKALPKPSFAVSPGTLIVISVPEKPSQEIEPYERALEVIHEDKWLMAINKPAGLTVHPGAGNPNQTVLNALAARFGAPKKGEAGKRPWIVHRLDKDTSGVLLIAKDDRTHRKLSEMFASRTIKKEYQALALSGPRGRSAIDREDGGRIERAIGRHPRERTRMAIAEEGGRSAVTEWRVIERFGYATLLGIRIETGRTHQIRVHLESIRAPVIGDRLYGDFTSLPRELIRLHERFGRQALHAAKLELLHPMNAQSLCLEAPMPADMAGLIAAFKAYGA